jgi:hypothetical protein
MAWYPTRLIDNCADSIKIVGRDQVAANSQYATLSHRWNASVPKLSVEKLREWEAGIQLAALPPTFRDFVTTARRLGFRYAWIDSLCIIQDGDGGADWTRESQTMDLVYRNSSCNFSAGWSSEDTGLFNIRDPRQADELVVTMSRRETENGEATYYPHRFSRCGVWDSEVTSAPLSTRGWVVQERFLSPRVFHFGRSEVLFECCESATVERYPVGPPALAPGIWLTHFKIFGIDRPVGNHTGHPYDIWKTVLRDYERCQLTFTSDKLAAISGIARYLQPYFDDGNYIMGVWTHRIELQSLWHCDRGMEEEFRCDEPQLQPQTMEELSPVTRFTGLPSMIASTPYRAPSFSWACIDDPILTDDPFGESPAVNAVVINYRSSRDTGDIPFRENIYDFLPGPKVEMKVVGRLNRARLVSSGVHGDDQLYLWPQVEGVNLVNADREFFLRGRRERLYSSAVLDFSITLADVPDIETRMFYYMIWAEGRELDNAPFELEYISCLIFALVDPDMGRFRRVGWMHTLDNRSGTPPVARRLAVYRDQQLPAEQATIPCWEYNHETNQHTIYVV